MSHIKLITWWLRQGICKPVAWLEMIVFCLFICVITALYFAQDQSSLSQYSAYVCWVSIMLGGAFTVHRIWAEDANQGFLHQLQIMPLSLPVIYACKYISHTILFTFISLLCALICLFLLGSAPITNTGHLLTIMLLAAPLLSAIHCMVAVLLLDQNNNIFLVFMLTMPLYVPIMLFGLHGIQTNSDGAFNQALIGLAGLALILLPCCSFFGILALKNHLQNNTS